MFKGAADSVRGDLFHMIAADYGSLMVTSIQVPKTRARKIDRAHIDALKEDFKLRTGLRHPIGVRSTRNGYWEVIFGAHRFVAWSELFEEALANDDKEGMETWHTIPCTQYPMDMPDDWAKFMELQENVRTKALSTEERQTMSGTMGSLAKKLLPQKVPKNDGVPEVPNGQPAMGPSMKDMTDATGMPRATLQHWWADFTADEGLPKDAPSKQPLAVTERFYKWLEGAAARKEHEETRKRHADDVTAAYDALEKLRKAGRDIDSLRTGAQKWISGHP